MQGTELTFIFEQGLDLMLKITAAIVVGLLLGYERQRRGKSVGILTAILVAMGSMMFVKAGVLLTQESGVSGDATRVASMIISGIGFIGAGAIMRSRFNVTGLASAATIWNLGGLGILIGLGYVIIAVGATLIIFVLLRLVPLFEHTLFQSAVLPPSGHHHRGGEAGKRVGLPQRTPDYVL